jgi:hypothetical protein
LELGDLLDVLWWVIVSSCEDERDRLGGETAPPDEPFVIGLDAEHSGEPDEAAVVWEDADGRRASSRTAGGPGWAS